MTKPLNDMTLTKGNIQKTVEALSPSEVYWEWSEPRRPLPEGPWQYEPVKVVWVDEDTGLDCMIVRSNGAGSLCGYVGVENSHSWFGLSWDHEDVDVRVHGGLTFADMCMEDGPADAVVCHVPQEGRSDEIWWLGFDCAHAWDYAPITEAFFPDIPMPDKVYRDIIYVIDEVKSLAKQLRNPDGQ